MFVADSTSTPSGPAAPAAGDPVTGRPPEDPRLVAAREVGDLIAAAKQRLMHEHGLGPDEAFELLRQYCRSSDLPMRDVARRLVHGAWLPGSSG